MLVVLALVLVMIWASVAPAGFWLGGWLVSLFVAVVCLPIAFLTTTVRISQSGIQATLFPFFRMSVRRESIATVRALEVTGDSLEGMGLRYLGNRTWGLIVGGPAIRVETVSGRTWIFSTPAPGELVAAFEGPPPTRDQP